MFQRICFFTFVLLYLTFPTLSLGEETSDSQIRSDVEEMLSLGSQTDEVSIIYKDIVAVQRKAKVKSGSILFNPSMTLDFSDGPQTLYGINFNIGYAFGEFWEVYLQTTPLFVVTDRKIVQILEEQNFELPTEEPKLQIGIDVLWLPAYGKDSWGPYSIVRSDTFFKLGLASLQTESKSSMRATLAIGKTFFLSKYWNLRVAAGASLMESLISETKQTQLQSAKDESSLQLMAIFDLGLVFYF